MTGAGENPIGGGMVWAGLRGGEGKIGGGDTGCWFISRIGEREEKRGRGQNHKQINKSITVF